MGILTTFKKALTGAFKRYQVFTIGTKWMWPMDNADTYIDRGYKDLPNVYSIISLIVQKAKTPPPEVFKVTNRAKYQKYKSKMKNIGSPKDLAEALLIKAQALDKVEGTDLEALLLKPNSYQSMEDLWEQWDGYKLITGNSYLWGWVPGVGKNSAVPQQLHVPPATMVSVITGDLENPVLEYKLSYVKDGIPAEEMCHIKSWRPLAGYQDIADSVYGMSPLTSCRRLMQKYRDADVSQGKMFTNMAPAGILSSDSAGNNPMTEDQAVAIKDKFRNMYQGVQNAGEIIITSANAKWNQIGFSPVDLNVLSAKEEILSELCNVYHVPMALFTKLSSTDNNIIESRKIMITDAVIPLVEARKNALNQWLCPKFDEGLVLEFDYSVFSEVSEELGKLTDSALKMWWITGNEKRVMTNYDKELNPLMDEILIPSNLYPLKDMFETREAVPSPDPGDEVDPKKDPIDAQT